MGPLRDYGILEVIFWLSAGMDKGKSESQDEARPCQILSGKEGGPRNTDWITIFFSGISRQLFPCCSTAAA